MIDKESLTVFLDQKKNPQILVIGDIMADRYVWGSANRISPEAPVPVVKMNSETITPGGAANVVQNLHRLKAEISLCGVVGEDSIAGVLLDQFKKEKTDTSLIVTQTLRPTTVKTRVMVGTHQLLRIDKEVTHSIDPATERALLKKLRTKIKHSDIVLISDYNKGLLTNQFTQEIIGLCNEENKKVLVDPKGLQYKKYTGAWLIKPNKRELAEATVTEKIDSEEDLMFASQKLLKQLKATYLVVTRSEEGITLISKKNRQHFFVKAKEVFDVTGAGDTVFASLGYFISMGLDIATACELANYAAAIAVGKVGTASVAINEILSMMNIKK